MDLCWDKQKSKQSRRDHMVQALTFWDATKPSRNTCTSLIPFVLSNANFCQTAFSAFQWQRQWIQSYQIYIRHWSLTEIWSWVDGVVCEQHESLSCSFGVLLIYVLSCELSRSYYIPLFALRHACKAKDWFCILNSDSLFLPSFCFILKSLGMNMWWHHNETIRIISISSCLSSIYWLYTIQLVADKAFQLPPKKFEYR